MRRIGLIVVAAAFTLAGCGVASSPTGAPGATTVAPTAGSAATAAPTQPQATAEAATAAPEATSTGATPDEALIALAQAQLAQVAGAGAQLPTLESATAQEWSDSSLGCPDPAVSYLQVITPGYLLVFSDGSQTYEVHTDASGGNIVVCDNGTPVNQPGANLQPADETPVPETDPAPGGPTGSAMAAMAIQTLASELGIGANSIQIKSVEAVEWRDSSLGCPQPDMMYMQVITPGYQIELEANGTTYMYHTDGGSMVVRCDGDQAVPPVGPQ